MVENKFLLLLQRLHQKTVEGAIMWEPGRYPDALSTVLGDFGVAIQAKNDPEYPHDPDFIIRLYNPQGEAIEEFSNATFRGMETGEVNPYEILKDLHTRARRSAYGVEKAIDALLDSLQ